MNKNSSGYILVLTLLVTSVITILVTQIFYQSSANLSLTDTILKKERARLLSMSGIELAKNQLNIILENKAKNQTSQPANPLAQRDFGTSDKNELFKKLLTNVLPYLNQWQTINLKEAEDGFDGQIDIYISCENGKINLNKIYDFSKHQFVDQGKLKNDYQKFMQDVFKRLDSYLEKKDAFQEYQKYMAERKFPLNDTTELLNIEKIDYFGKNLFLQQLKKDEKSKVYLTDLFTVWTDKNGVEPWMISASLQKIFNLDANKDDIIKREQLVSDWVSKFKMRSNWSQDWNESLKNVYGKEFSAVPKEFSDIFNSAFTAEIFSVISYGTVSGITQKTFAILSLDINENGIQPVLKKLYWI